MSDEFPQAVLRIRLSQTDAHYGGNLVPGSRIVELFGDLATELCVRMDGDEGLFAAYEEISFTAPVHAGDFLEVRGRIIGAGQTSRRMAFEARKYVIPRPEISESAAEVLEEPLVVARAIGTCVVQTTRQRGRAATRLARDVEHLFDEG
ncbi:MAG TPA: hotdog fold domain-containing protein [Actinomycetota bacterium]|nr:hotdog fold domain-containing protein [Actinomycetota bacterium]